MMKGETVKLSEALDVVFDRFLAFIGLKLLVALKIFLWSLLLIVPGIYMYFRYSLSGVAFFDKNLSARASIKRSVMLTKRAWITTYATQTLFQIVTLTLIPFLVEPAVNGVLYKYLGSFEDSNKDKPKPHILSWATLLLPALGFIMSLLLTVFIASNNLAL